MPRLDQKDRDALVERMASWSARGTPDGPDYFKYLVRQADFDDDLKFDGTAGFKGGAKYNALWLCDWAAGIDTNPKDRNKALGSILLPMMHGALGLEDRTFVASLIVKYGLVRSKDTLDELKARYQIPDRLTAEAVERGPDVKWAKDTDELVLQGWFAPDPEWLDVGLLLTAANRARSVCRVEVDAIGEMGTGVLIAPDLALTNYHVLGGDLTAPRAFLEQNAPSTVLRFGAFSANAAQSAEGQTVRLAAQNPVVACSQQYDFALMRTDNLIDKLTDVGPFATLGKKLPVRRDALYVLQHPRGGPMKLALSTNGVSWVDPQSVTLQYTAKFAGGSSGSPCFDGDWNLTALHHAGSSTKGEGILMSSIFKQITNYLNA